MTDAARLATPPTLDRDDILERLDTVLDPELDESILSLGFVRTINMTGGHLTVELELPTYWCAANFSYLMASDARRELLMVDGVQEVSVRLTGHFASKAIETGVNSGRSFTEAFPDEASENLGQIRDLFLRKGYINRQESLLSHLRRAGLSWQEISGLLISDLQVDEESCWVRRAGAGAVRAGPARVALRYLERRTHLGLDCSPSAPLIADLSGASIPADRLETYFIRSRTVRLSAEANGALCSVLLQARKGERSSI